MKTISTETLKSARRKSALIKEDKPDTNSRQRAARTKSTKYTAHTELSVRSLVDIRAFADLIKFHGGWDNFGECHDELADFICKPQVDELAQAEFLIEGNEYGAYLRRLVLMPRGHLKSTVGTVLYTLWRIYRNPNIRILVACNLQTLAFSFIRELRSYLENPDLLSVWNNRPHIPGNLLPALDKRNRTRNSNLETEAEDRKVIWNNTALQVNRSRRFKEPTVYATSVGTTVTGQHYDLVILDDLVDFKNVESEVKKTQVEEWIADVESVLNPPELINLTDDIYEILGGEILINGTRYAVDDYYAQVIAKAEELGYQVHIRSVYKDKGNPAAGYLWHEKYTDRIIQSLQARLSPRRYASQYLNEVYEKDTALFAVERIKIIDDSAVYAHAGHLYCNLGNGVIERVVPIIAVDPAFSSSKTADDCSVGVGFKLRDGTLVVAELVLDRMEAKAFVEHSQRLARKYETLRLFCERNGVGMLVAEVFKNRDTYVDGRPIIVYDHWEQRVKESKIQGVLELPIAAGKVWFTQSVRNNERAWKQLCNYPAVRHDDFLDMLVTLYEKTTPAREVFKPTLQNVNFGGLEIGKVLTGEKEPETYLGEYNDYYR